MSYQAIITPIVNVREHPQADRLNLGTASGYQVVIGKDVEEGTLGVFFASDGQLSLEMAANNNLHRHTELNIDPKAKAGFFDDNRRIRAQKLRGAISDGFWTELKALEWTGVELSTLKAGQLIDTLNGKPVCNKYITKATRLARSKSAKNSKMNQRKQSFPQFKEHFDTQKLRMAIAFIPEGAVLSCTEKVHGTSARTGYLPQELPMNWFKNLWNKTLGRFGVEFVNSKYEYVSGSRRVLIDTDKPDQGFYEGKKFRQIAHKMISDNLHKGETVYYEIVGYDDGGSSIMGSHKVSDKELKKKYGSSMTYSYGCQPVKPGTENAELPFKIFIYRITITTLDGSITEVPWHQMVTRCKEMNIPVVPQLKEPFIYDGDKDKLMKLCEELSQGSSTLDSSHIKEGVVIRVEAPSLDKHYKYKSWHFCDLEGIAKNSNNYIDQEEIS